MPQGDFWFYDAVEVEDGYYELRRTKGSFTEVLCSLEQGRTGTSVEFTQAGENVKGHKFASMGDAYLIEDSIENQEVRLF